MKAIDHLGLAEESFRWAKLYAARGLIEDARQWLKRCRLDMDDHIRARDADVFITPVAREAEE